MPVNSFEHYPMSWKPDKNKLNKPLYKSIAEYLEQDIKNGILRENDKLPPQRELADYLDLNLSTITRAYKICEMKGLIYATTGRGSFVSANVNSPATIIDNAEPSLIELGIVLPFIEHNSIISSVAADILCRSDAESYFDYSNPLGSISQRRTAKKWLGKFNVKTKEENIIITAGAQNALAITLVSLFKSGDKIITDRYTFANFVSLANMLNIQLISVDGDEHGMLPDKLESVCKNNQIRGIYLMPTCNNPNNIIMNNERRKEIADIVGKYHLIMIEDDIYAFLSQEQYLPMVNLIPNQTVYISGVSKSICAGIRVAYICFPDSFRAVLEQGLYNLNLKTSSLNIEIVTEIINKCLDEDLIHKKRNLAMERNELYLKYFPYYPGTFNKSSYYQWLLLPDDCSGRLFEAQAESNGIKVYGAERFCVGEVSHANAIRIATSSPQNMDELEKGLTILKKIYDSHTDNIHKSQLIV